MTLDMSVTGGVHMTVVKQGASCSEQAELAPGQQPELAPPCRPQAGCTCPCEQHFPRPGCCKGDHGWAETSCSGGTRSTCSKQPVEGLDAEYGVEDVAAASSQADDITHRTYRGHQRSGDGG